MVRRVLKVRVLRVLRVLSVLLVLGVLSTLGTSTISTLNTISIDSTWTAPLSAQGAARLATNPDALVAAPVFFHGKQIAVRRDVEPAGALLRLTGTGKPIFVFWRDSPMAP